MKSITGKPWTLFMIACATIEETLHMSTEQLFYKTFFMKSTGGKAPL